MHVVDRGSAGSVFRSLVDTVSADESAAFAVERETVESICRTVEEELLGDNDSGEAGIDTPTAVAMDRHLAIALSDTATSGIDSAAAEHEVRPTSRVCSWHVRRLNTQLAYDPSFVKFVAAGNISALSFRTFETPGGFWWSTPGLL
jgi:hypothetical protein